MTRLSSLPVRPRSLLTGFVLSVLVAACATAALGPSAGAGAMAFAARTCKPPRYPGFGYFTSLTVSGVSCSKGGKVAIAFYYCRLHSGGVKGYCHSKPYGFTCHEKRNSIPIEIDARVTCKLHNETVIHTYQQNI